MISAAGCQSINTNWTKKLPWSKEARLAKSKYETPARLATIWTPDIMAAPGQPAVRGFGGRIYFYNASDAAIPVEGQLVVYAFDDTTTETCKEKPDRMFAFSPEQFTRHYSHSDLGASYSVWIPWDEVGGDLKNISLLPVFTSTRGELVMGQQAMNLLPGREVPRGPQLTQQPTPSPANGVRPAGFQPAEAHSQSRVEPVSHDSQNPQNVRTTTIKLPRTLSERLRAAAIMEQNAASNLNQFTTPVAPASLPPQATVTSAPMASNQFGAVEAVPVNSRGNPPITHSSHQRFPAPRGPIARLDRADWHPPQHPGAPQFSHPYSQQPPPQFPVQGSSAGAVGSGP